MREALVRVLVVAAWACLGAGCSSEESAGGSGGSAGGGAGGSAGSAGSAGAGGSAGAAGGTACSGTLTLQNDGFENQQQAAFQGGFVQGECFGVILTPPAGCTVTLRDAVFLVGGGDPDAGAPDGGTQDFTVEIRDVEASGAPGAVLGSLVAPLPTSGDVMAAVPLGDLAIPARSTPFVVAGCHTAHGGFPSVARDADGITADANWIFSGGAWVEASTLGVAGDWILRATVAAP